MAVARNTGVKDHGRLDGLGDDDHAQYLNTARHGAIGSNPHGVTAGDVGALPISGGTLTGDLVLAGDPDAALKAATKQYVDTQTVGTAHVVDTKANILASSPADPTVAFATDNGRVYFWDGSAWYETPLAWVVNPAAPDMGAEQDSSRQGYGPDYISDKRLSHVLIGSNDREEEGAIRTSSGALQIFLAGAWNDTGDLILDGEVVVGVDQSANRAPRAVKLHYNDVGNDRFGTWYPVSPAGWTRVATQVGDMWGVYSYSESDGLTFDFSCDTAVGCERNGSRVQAHVLGFHITPYLQRTFGLEAVDGAYTFTALVDRYGFPAADGCEPVSLDCLPMYVDGVPAAVEQFQHRDGRYMEMDVYFGDEPSGWIALPAVGE